MNIHWIRKDSITTVQDLHHAIADSPEGTIGIISSEVIEHVPSLDLVGWMQNADIVHSGLSFGAENAFRSVQLCTFNWHFLNPSKDRPAVSWKATLDFVLFDRQLIGRIGEIDVNYITPTAAVMDWVYRALVAGAKTINQPLPFLLRPAMDSLNVNIADEMLFVSKHFNRKASNFYRFCQFFLHGKILKRRAVLSAGQTFGACKPFKLMLFSGKQSITSYSAVIPTIDRYDYITKSIDSLLTLRFPPSEIVVVDQTSKERRKPELYEPYIRQGVLKLIFLDTAGQSTARNRGLAEITHPWVLLFEDDSEAWPDMVDEHIDLVSKSGCDVSTGVIVPPGAGRDFILERNRRFFLADIFTTGNAFLKRETALSVGGLDPAFDHGPGADDDFGKRLYIAGKVIVYNYKSIETHYKAPSGGMRVHGIWWRNKSTVLGPYPPVTQTFGIMKYYPKKYYVFLFMTMILKARKKYSLASYMLFLFLLPYKIFISIRRANKLGRIL